MYHIGNDGQKDEWKYLDKNIINFHDAYATIIVCFQPVVKKGEYGL
jgi:hypothetical protein